MNKTEKLLLTFIIWVYAGTLISFIFGGLFGGQATMIFFSFGLIVSSIGAVSRTIYLGFTYNADLAIDTASKTRNIIRRLFIGILYSPFIFLAVVAIFYP